MTSITYTYMYVHMYASGSRSMALHDCRGAYLTNKLTYTLYLSILNWTKVYHSHSYLNRYLYTNLIINVRIHPWLAQDVSDLLNVLCFGFTQCK